MDTPKRSFLYEASSEGGAGFEVAVAVGAGVAAGVTVGVGLGDGVGTGVAVGMGVGVGVAVGDGVGVAVGRGVEVGGGVSVGVAVAAPPPQAISSNPRMASVTTPIRTGAPLNVTRFSISYLTLIRHQTRPRLASDWVCRPVILR